MAKKDTNTIMVKMDIKKDIIDRIDCLEHKNTGEHQEIIKHLIKTNGKVKLGFWIATTAMAITVVLMGFVFKVV